MELNWMHHKQQYYKWFARYNKNVDAIEPLMYVYPNAFLETNDSGSATPMDHAMNNPRGNEFFEKGVFRGHETFMLQQIS